MQEVSFPSSYLQWLLSCSPSLEWLWCNWFVWSHLFLLLWTPHGLVLQRSLCNAGFFLSPLTSAKPAKKMFVTFLVKRNAWKRGGEKANDIERTAENWWYQTDVLNLLGEGGTGLASWNCCVQTASCSRFAASLQDECVSHSCSVSVPRGGLSAGKQRAVLQPLTVTGSFSWFGHQEPNTPSA